MTIILDGTTGITTPGLINTGTETVVNLTTSGNTTLGDASGDTLTLNGSTVSTPNGLNFDSNTLVIDAANNRIAVNGSDSSVGGGQMVVNQANNNGLVINQTGSGNGASIYLRNATDTTINNFNFTNSGVRFFDVGTNSERMRIDSSGNVGIGTSSPSYKLDVSGQSNLNGIRIGLNGDTINASGNLLAFQGAGTERMRIDSSGNLLVGNTTENGMVSIKSDSTSGGRKLFNVKTNGGTEICVMFQSGVIYLPTLYGTTTGAGANMTIAADGQLFRSTSSLKYKTNVQDVTHGLDEVLQLRPVTYKGKSETDGDKVFGGLIAEEVHEIGLSEFVQYAEDGTPDAIHYGNMVSLAFKAIQEQQAIIQSQADTITAMEVRLTALENK